MPAILIGRLAAAESYQKTPDRIGEKLRLDALGRAARLRKEAGALGVLVDAIDEQAQTFYTLHHSLFLKMSKIAAVEKNYR